MCQPDIATTVHLYQVSEFEGKEQIKFTDLFTSHKVIGLSSNMIHHREWIGIGTTLPTLEAR